MNNSNKRKTLAMVPNYEMGKPLDKDLGLPFRVSGSGQPSGQTTMESFRPGSGEPGGTLLQLPEGSEDGLEGSGGSEDGLGEGRSGVRFSVIQRAALGTRHLAKVEERPIPTVYSTKVSLHPLAQPHRRTDHQTGKVKISTKARKARTEAAKYDAFLAERIAGPG